MMTYSTFVGIDPSKQTFAAAVYRQAGEPCLSCDGFANEPSGFENLIDWVKNQDLKLTEVLICIEATGVYSEALCYYLHHQNLSLWLASPDQVKQAFRVKGHKTDPVDAAQIAEYAYRYQDKCRLWEPKPAVLEHLNVLLGTRELLIRQRTATTNALKTYKLKSVHTPMVLTTLQQQFETLTEKITSFEEEIKRLIKSQVPYQRLYEQLTSVPGIGFLTAANLIVVTKGGSQLTTYQRLAAYLGICPYQHRSGTSVRKRDRSTGLGHERLRKVLHLASRSLAHNSTNAYFRGYYARKKEQGKANRLIYNNLSNKILRIACALMKSGKQYDCQYRSLKPI